MKVLFTLMVFFVTNVVIAQSDFKIKVVDSITGKPMVKKWVTILKNYDEQIAFMPTDSVGTCTFTIKKYDSTATYQVEIVNRWNNQIEPGLHDITAINKIIPIIKVTQASYPMPNGCGEVMYRGYRPRVPYTMNDLPSDIKQKVDIYITNRVGINFYKKITLNGGQIVNLQRYYLFDSLAKTNNRIPPAYSLCFTIMDSNSHAGIYNFQLLLDSTGKLLHPIPLPDIKHKPERANILSLSKAKSIANVEGFNKKWTDAITSYHDKTQSIVWQFEQIEPGDGLKRLDTLLIDACNGKIVDRLTSYVSVVY